jgi:hypothetical protein
MLYKNREFSQKSNVFSEIVPDTRQSIIAHQKISDLGFCENETEDARKYGNTDKKRKTIKKC